MSHARLHARHKGNTPMWYERVPLPDPLPVIHMQTFHVPKSELLWSKYFRWAVLSLDSWHLSRRPLGRIKALQEEPLGRCLWEVGQKRRLLFLKTTSLESWFWLECVLCTDKSKSNLNSSCSLTGSKLDIKTPLACSQKIFLARSFHHSSWFTTDSTHSGFTLPLWFPPREKPVWVESCNTFKCLLDILKTVGSSWKGLGGRDWDPLPVYMGFWY